MKDNNYNIVFELCSKGLITPEVLANIINEGNISTLDVLLDIYRKNLITMERLAYTINDYITKKNPSVKDNRERLIEENRKKAEENRKRVEEIKEKRIQEQENAKQDEEREKMIKFLMNVEDSRGRRIYGTDNYVKYFEEMDYLELKALYLQISEVIEKHDNQKMKERREDFRTIREFTSPEIGDKPSEVKSFSPTGDLGEPKKTDPEFTIPEIEGKPSETIPTDDPLDDFDKEETYERAQESACTEEPSKAVISVREPSEERKERLKDSKEKVKSKFEKAITVVTTFALVTLAGPIFGIGSYVAFKKAVKNGTWDPKGKNPYYNYLKENMLYVLNKLKNLDEKVGGKSK